MALLGTSAQRVKANNCSSLPLVAYRLLPAHGRPMALARPHHQVGKNTLSNAGWRGRGSEGLEQVSGILQGPFGCLQGSDCVAGQDPKAGKVLLVLPAERVPGQRSCWGLHKGRVGARLWHGHTQPPAAVAAARSRHLRGPLSPSWAPLGWGGVRSPEPTPWQPHRAGAAPAPCPSPPRCQEPSLPGTLGGSGAALPFVFPSLCLSVLQVFSARSHFWVEPRLPSELLPGSILPFAPRSHTQAGSRPFAPGFCTVSPLSDE